MPANELGARHPSRGLLGEGSSFIFPTAPILIVI